MDKIFKVKKQKEILDEIIHAEIIEENKEILSKQIETSIKEHVDKTQDNKKETLDVFEKARRK